MSLRLDCPAALMSAAMQWENVGSALTAANLAAAPPTIGPAAAAIDEVSTSVAALFDEYGREYQAISAQVSAFGERLVETLREGARSYSAAEVANVSALLATPSDLPGLGGATVKSAGSAAALIGTADVVQVAQNAFNDASLFLSEQVGIYDFRDWRGWASFALDYTWGLPGTALGYGLHLVNHLTPGAVYDATLSQKVGWHVYHGGVGLSGFTTTLGNVTTHAGTGASALDLLINHEQVHLWQSRIFGPVFQTTYVGWLIGGAAVGTGYWLFHPNENLFSLIETAAYYDNPWEVWAYAYDHNWPPQQANPALTWPAWTNPVLLWPASTNLFAPLWRS